tara:strand:- start:90727 stop:91095 length:369 start_codon:yes stop_codon:yes gene_type:complete
MDGVNKDRSGSFDTNVGLIEPTPRVEQEEVGCEFFWQARLRESSGDEPATELHQRSVRQEPLVSAADRPGFDVTLGDVFEAHEGNAIGLCVTLAIPVVIAILALVLSYLTCYLNALECRWDI